MQNIDWIQIATAVLLLAGMTYAGTRGASGITEEDYLVGGRAIKDWMLAGTISAGLIGGGVLLVFSEYVFRYGLSAFCIIGGIVVGTLLMIPVASKFKPLADKQLFYTLPDLYSYQWGRLSGILATIVVSFWTIGFIIMQLISAGIILHTMTNLPYSWGVVAAAVTVASYLVIAGFRAVVITDILQYAALIILLVIVFPAASSQINLAAIVKLTASNPMNWGDAVGFFLLGALNIIVSADMWQRFYAAKSKGDARRGLIFSACAVLFAGILLMTPPFFARLVIPGVAPNSALVESLSLLLPRWLLGFGLVGVLSTVVATLDTMVFILGISIGHDIRIKYLHRSIDNRLWATRVSIVVALFVGSVISILYENLLNTGLALSTLGLVLAPSLLLSLGKRYKLSAFAANAGIVCGLAATALLFVASLFQPNLLTPQNTLVALVAAVAGTFSGMVIGRWRKATDLK